VKEVRSCVELVQTENVPEYGSPAVLRLDDLPQKIAFCYPDGRNGVKKELNLSFKSVTDSGLESSFRFEHFIWIQVKIFQRVVLAMAGRVLTELGKEPEICFVFRLFF